MSKTMNNTAPAGSVRGFRYPRTDAPSRRNSISSFLSIQSRDGDNPPGHYVVVYDTLDKRIYMESPESVMRKSETLALMKPMSNSI